MSSEHPQVPAYLLPKNFQTLKSSISKLNIVCTDFESFLTKSPMKYSKFNLSDIFEYMSEDHADQLFDLIFDHSPTGSRIAYWTLLIDRKPAALRTADLQSHPWTPLQPGLAEQDRLWFYENFYCIQK